MEMRKANRYNTTNVIPSRSLGKKNKTSKISSQLAKKEESTDQS